MSEPMRDELCAICETFYSSFDRVALPSINHQSGKPPQVSFFYCSTDVTFAACSFLDFTMHI